MREYRDPLDAAQRRIQQLEGELADRPAPTKESTPVWVGALAAVGGLVVFFLLLGVGTMIVASATSHPPYETPPAPPEPPTPAAPALDAAPVNSAFQLADLNGDSHKDVVTFFKRADERSLYLVALDGQSLLKLWHYGPILDPIGIPSFLATSTRVVVDRADGSSALTLLDGQTGAVADTAAFLADPVTMCSLTSTGDLVRLHGGDKHASLDLHTATVRAIAPSDLPCPVCPADSSIGCEEPIAQHHRYPHLAVFQVTRLGDFHLVEGIDNPSALPSPQPQQILLVTDGGHVLWRVDPKLPADVLAEQDKPIASVLTHEGVLSWYRKRDEHTRIILRGRAAAAVVWETHIPASAHEYDVQVDGSNVFALGKDGLHVFDLASGRALGAVASL